MAGHNEIGRKGEEAALLHLAKRGYRLLERNWRLGHLEVDIIAERYGVLVFVEVKTSANEDFGSPAARVDLKKRDHLIKAANAYVRGEDVIVNVRFDIIAVVGEEEPFRITHIKDAFSVTDTRLQQGR